ncbi:MAG: hypothetical protein GWP19_10100 [Planctomycetia bacterium]|nr:hypothetical protein [Planctomycetia bacterium]
MSLFIVKTFKLKNIKLNDYFMLGLFIAFTYNLSGKVFGFFDITIAFLILAALQQGVITYIVAKFKGIK